MLFRSQKLPMKGNVFISVKNKDKRDIVFVVKKLEDLGFGIIATEGTANALRKFGIKTEKVNKVAETYPTVLDFIKEGKINMIINTPVGKGPKSDDYRIRTLAITAGVPYTTTMSGAQAVVTAIEAVKVKGIGVKPLQEYYTAAD